MKHDLGYNWSLYQRTLLQRMFGEIFEKQIDISIYDSTLTFQFTE
jgi:hypothetical protein